MEVKNAMYNTTIHLRPFMTSLKFNCLFYSIKINLYLFCSSHSKLKLKKLIQTNKFGKQIRLHESKSHNLQNMFNFNFIEILLNLYFLKIQSKIKYH